MMTYRPFRFKSIVDALIFLVGMTLINFVWFSHDPAFRSIVWHPYLLVITLIGLFYGLRESLFATALSYIFFSSYLSFAGFPFTSMWLPPHKLTVLSFIIAGFFFGEVGELYRRNLKNMKERADGLDNELNSFRNKNEDLKAVNEELQTWIGFGDIQLTEIHNAKEKLFSLDEPQVLECALELVKKIIGPDQCAVYLFDRTDKKCWRHSAIGRNGVTNPSLVSSDTTPFQEVIKDPRIVSIKETYEKSPSPIRYIAAAPLLSQNELIGVFLIESMPLIRLSSLTLSNFSLLIDIINQSLDSAALHRIRTGKETLSIQNLIFKNRLEQEIHLSERFNSPLSVLNFEIENYKRLKENLKPDVLQPLTDQVRQVIDKKKRKSDTLTYKGDGQFALLMPQTPAEKTDAFIVRASEEAGVIEVPLNNKDKEKIQLSFQLEKELTSS